MKELIEKLKGIIGEKAVGAVLSYFLTEERIKAGAKALLDIVEDLAKKTETQIDDKAIAKIRAVLNI